MNWKHSMILCVCLCLSTSACAPSFHKNPTEAPLEKIVANPQEALKEQLAPHILRIMETLEIPGIAIGIVTKNEILYTGAFGFRNVETQDPLTDESLFYLASITKVFTATAIMQLVEQRRIDLDAPVTTYLPYFQLADSRYTQITVKHLLNHTSGLSYWEQEEDTGDDDIALERYIKRLKTETLLFDPGTQYSYSNIGYCLLGDVIANISEMPYETYMQIYLFDPLKMRDTTFFTPEIPLELRVTGYQRHIMAVEKPVESYIRAKAPAGRTLHSNVVDMCRWLMANLNKGQLDGVTILPSSRIDELWQPTITAGEIEVGLGWHILPNYREGTQMLYHEGHINGFITTQVILPEQGVGFVALMNSDSGSHLIPFFSICDSALNIVHGIEPISFPVSGSVLFSKALKEHGIDEAIQQVKEKQIRGFYRPEIEEELESIGLYLLQEHREEEAGKVWALRIWMLEQKDATPEQLVDAHGRFAEIAWVNGATELTKYHAAQVIELSPDLDELLQKALTDHSREDVKALLELLPENPKAVRLLQQLEQGSVDQL